MDKTGMPVKRTNLTVSEVAGKLILSMPWTLFPDCFTHLRTGEIALWQAVVRKKASQFQCVRQKLGNGGKSPGTQVQHTLSIGTKGTEFRRFLASNCGTI
jgi:hypothetical protein